MRSTIGKDIEAQQAARAIVKGAWGCTPSGSIADSWQQRVIARIEEKLDAMSALVETALMAEAN
jgi:hypothetical protein